MGRRGPASTGSRPNPVLVVERHEAVRLALEGVYERREARIGVHFDQDRIRSRPGRPVSELIALMPMVELYSDPTFGGLQKEVLFRQRQFDRLIGPAASPCYPQVFVNGSLFSPGGNVPGQLGLISLNDLEAVEVYDSPSGLPGRFRGMNPQCGTIVLWSR